MRTKNFLQYLFLALIIFTACEEDDDEPNGTATASFSIDNIVEVENATEGLSVNVGYDNAAHGGGTVSISVSGGTYGADYVTSGEAATFTLDVPASALLSTFSITPVDDDIIEDNVPLTVSISSVDGALSLGDVTSFTYTILDDDDPLVAMVSFESETQAVAENATEGIPVNIVFNQASTDGGTISIAGSGDAVFETDYTIDGQTSENFTLDIAAGATGASFTITPVDNTDFGEDVTATFTISEVSGGLTLGADVVSNITIVNDEPAPVVAVVSFETETQTVDENSTDAIPVSIIFDQEPTDGGVITIAGSGDAAFGTDYTIDGQTAENFTIDVPAGATGASFVLVAVDDADFGPDVTATFTITEVTGGLSLGDDLVTNITFTNDDAAPNPVIDFDTANTLQFSEDVGMITVNFTLSEALTAEATVELTATGTGTIGSDYTIDAATTSPYSFTIPVGATTGSVVLSITDDMDVEDDETIALEITSTTGGVDPGVNVQSQTFTITNNDSNTTALNYLETFEGNDGSDNTYLEDVLMYQSAMVNQTIANQRFDLISNGGNFSDADDVTAPSDNGLNFFYNSQSDPANYGNLDTVIITTGLEGTGATDISFDTAYAFRSQNSATLTFYWSDTYDGSGNFDPASWTVLDTETASDMNDEGLGNNDYKRQAFTINPTATFYIAVRLEQTVDETSFRTRWRLDNFRAISQ